MARPEKCANCTKPTTIHLTQIVNGKVVKLDICEDCVFKDQVVDPVGFSLAELLSANPKKTPVGVEVPFPELEGDGSDAEACPACGCTPGDLHESRRFGCPACYDHFRPVLEQTLTEVQYAGAHVGKVPTQGESQALVQERRRSLADAMQKAILEERYEDAAGIRDELRGLEAE